MIDLYVVYGLDSTMQEHSRWTFEADRKWTVTELETKLADTLRENALDFAEMFDHGYDDDEIEGELESNLEWSVEFYDEEDHGTMEAIEMGELK